MLVLAESGRAWGLPFASAKTSAWAWGEPWEEG